MCGNISQNVPSATCTGCTKYYRITDNDNNSDANSGWLTFKAPVGCKLTVTMTTDGNYTSGNMGRNGNGNNRRWDYLYISESTTGSTQDNTNSPSITWRRDRNQGDATTFETTNAGSYVTVYFYNNSTGNSRFRLTISCNCSSPCDNATNLPCGTTDLAGTTVGTANVNHGTGYDISNYGVWYTFTGNGNQTTISSTGGYGFDQKMVIVSGSCGNFTQVTQQDTYGAGWTETYTFTAQNGVNYYVYIAYWDEDGTSNETGTFTISRTCVTPPSNSTCATATNLPCGTSNLEGTTVGTTGTAHGIPGATPSNYGVWYTFVGDGNMTTITTSSGSFDNCIVVAKGSCNNLSLVQYVDLYGPWSGDENYSFLTENGVTYYVYVAYYDDDGTSDETGAFTISRTCATAPSNSSCATATNLPCGTSNLEGTTVETPGTAHGIPNADVSNYGVWYTFVGDGNVTTITSTAAYGFDHEMDICSGSCNNLTLIAYKDAGLDGGTESYTFQTTNGVTYYVYIAYYSDYDNTTGSFTISRTCVEPLCPPSDMCELTFELTDSYGDSWNGNAIRVTDVAAGTVLADMANEDLNGTSGSGENEVNTLTLSVCRGRELSFSWVSGSYQSECSYTVYDVNGDVIFSGTAGNSLPLTYTPSCTVCPQPTNVTVTDITNNTATVSWNGSADSYNVRYRIAGNDIATSSFVQVDGDQTVTGILTEYTFDLSDYSGQGCIAIRHYNISDMFRLNVDDINLTDAGGNNIVSEDFESGVIPAGWLNYDNDGDGFLWGIWANNDDAQGNPFGTGNYIAYSESYDNDNNNPLTPDNWLIIPNVALGGTLSLYSRGMDPDWAAEVFGVFVTTETYIPTGDWIYVNNVNGTALNIIGLTSGTTYEVQVQADCDGALSPWTPSEIFTTCNLNATIEFGD